MQENDILNNMQIINTERDFMRSVLYSLLGGILVVLNSFGSMQAMDDSANSDSNQVQMEEIVLDSDSQIYLSSSSLATVRRLVAESAEHKQRINMLKFYRWGYRVTVALLCVV